MFDVLRSLREEFPACRVAGSGLCPGTGMCWLRWCRSRRRRSPRVQSRREWRVGDRATRRGWRGPAVARTGGRPRCHRRGPAGDL
jgi:hypothetical protein